MRAAWLLLLWSTPVSAQLVSPLRAPDTSALATKAEVEALQAQVPKPAAAVPPSEQVGGTVGTAGTYRPADSAQPRITRAGTVMTDANGGWSVTWASPLLSVPTVLPVPINTSPEPIVCNVAARSTTNASGRCWLARTLPAALTVLASLVSYDLFGAPVAGVQVQVIALPPTQ